MIEIKPFQQFDKAVYIDGDCVPAQLIENPVVEYGKVKFTCFTNKVSKPANIEKLKLHPSYVTHSTELDADGLEKTTFTFKYDIRTD